MQILAAGHQDLLIDLVAKSSEINTMFLIFADIENYHARQAKTVNLITGFSKCTDAKRNAQWAHRIKASPKPDRAHLKNNG